MDDNTDVEVRITNKGRGVFALRDFKKGEITVVGHVISYSTDRTNYTIQVDWDKHINVSEPALLMNHSCAPNTGVQDNHHGAYNFIALRDIQAGEELTWDYETTEYISISVSNCLCGSEGCRGATQGFKFLSPDIQSAYGDYIANYLKGEPPK